MGIGENIMQALTSLKVNKLRAILTMLGVIIGVAAVIAIVTLGNSLTGSITEEMQSFGVGNITVYVQQRGNDFVRVSPMGGGFGGIGEENLISDDMLEELREKYPDDIKAFSLSVSVGSGQTTKGEKYANLSLTGANTEYADANDITITRGRFISEHEDETKKNVAVVSDKLVSSMFGEEDPIGKEIDVDTGSHFGIYTIVGVYESDSESFSMSGESDADVSTEVYIPLKTAQKIAGSTGYQSLTVITNTQTDTTAFTETVTNFFNNKYYSRNEEYQVSSSNMESMIESVTDMLSTVSLAIAAIAAISLLVGGIGVMNIMLVSITERTREIGVRKALGATNGEIRLQFIIEAVVICLIGGLIGIGLGVALGAIGAKILGYSASASVLAMLIASGFSMVLGVFFGYYPANKAAKLDPIDALRFE